MPPSTTASRNAPAAARIAKLGPPPQTYEQALAAKDAARWKRAIEEEICRLDEKGVWTPTSTPPGFKPVGSRWVFQRIPTPNGIEYRARVVAKGGDMPSEAQEKTPGPSASVLLFLLAYAVENNLEVTHIRVEDPCLTVNIESPVTIAVPPGYKIKGRNALVLNKTLYGLKSANAAGLQAVREGLARAGLYLMSSEPSLLVADDAGLDVEGDNTAIAMTYSGGIAVAGPPGYGEEVLEALQRTGLTAIVGPRDLILGLTIRPFTGRDPSKPSYWPGLTVSQPQYVDTVVRRFDQILASSTPPSPTPTRELMSHLRAFAGCLSWLASTTHPLQGPIASQLSSCANRRLSTEEWGLAWGLAGDKLNDLKKSNQRNNQTVIINTLANAPQLLAAVSVTPYGYQTMIMLHGAPIQWHPRNFPAEWGDDGTWWRGVEAAVASLAHWRAVLREFVPVRDAAIYVDEVRPLPVEHPKLLKSAVKTQALMAQEGIDFKPYPEANANGHRWCPCCCPQAVGDGA